MRQGKFFAQDSKKDTEFEKSKAEEITVPAPEPVKEEVIVEPVVEENSIKLDEYLATYSRHRNLDKVITKWCARNGMAGSKPVKLWDSIIDNFFKETDTQ